MSIFNSIKINDARLQYLLGMKNMVNAGFLRMTKTEYDDLFSFDSFFLEQHEYWLREKNRLDMENKKKEEEEKRRLKNGSKGRSIVRG